MEAGCDVAVVNQEQRKVGFWLAIVGKLDAGMDEGVVMVGDGIGNGMGLF